MKEKSSEAMSIIGGADGPTSVFIAGKSDKMPFKARVKRFFYQCRSKRVEKGLFGISYSCPKKERKYFTRIMQDLYRYYGVTEEDIHTKSERYRVLMTILSV